MRFGWSKTPLKMLLILIAAFIVNFALVLGLQMLLQYRVTGPIDETVLAKLDNDYDNCTILDQVSSATSTEKMLTVYLVSQADGTEQLVTVQKHYLFDRYRIVKSACTQVPAGDDSVQLRAGSTLFYIDISFNQVSGHSDIRWGTQLGLNPRTQFSNNMLLCIAGLCIVELLAWCLLFQKEEIRQDKPRSYDRG